MASHVCCRSGEDHCSLTDVLQDLQGQLSGQEPKLSPGQTQSRPLHVVLQVNFRWHDQSCMQLCHFTLGHLGNTAVIVASL